MRAVILVSLLVFALVTGKSVHDKRHEKGDGKSKENSHEKSHAKSHEDSAQDISGLEHLKPRCGCQFEDKPVCGTMKDGSEVDFESPCKARCGGAEHFTEGPCEIIPVRLCGCPPGGEPVCGTVNDELVEFENHCKAGCSDAENIFDGPCIISSIGEPAFADPIDFAEDPVPVVPPLPDFLVPEIDDSEVSEEPDITRDEMVALGLNEGEPAEESESENINSSAPGSGEQPAEFSVATHEIDAELSASQLPTEMRMEKEDESDEVEGQVNPLERRDRGLLRRDAGLEKRDVIHINTGKGKHCGHKKHGKKVCGEMPDGKKKTFKNKCKAEHAGAINIKEGKCKCHRKPHKHCHSHEDSHSHEDLPSLCGCPPFGDPVCGHFPDGSKKNFENGCHASCAGARAIINGNCANPPLCGCPPIYDPVCGRMADGFLQDFDNHCQAGCGGAGEITRGKCNEKDDHNDDEQEDLPPLPPLCGCPPFGDPVCGHFPDGSKRDFENGCHASCAGARAIIKSTCATPPLCGCPPIHDPVCGRMADGFLQDFDNHCQAGCGGANEITEGPCHSEELPLLCGCPPIDDPVCGTMADGSKKDFDNRCQAGCGGATDITPGSCPGEEDHGIFHGMAPAAPQDVSYEEDQEEAEQI